jgi:DNA-binding NtrC family response regulator
VPAPVLVVHDDPDTRALALAALRAAGLEAVAFADPMVALDAIEADSRVRVLVTSTTFPAGKPNGVALGRMLKLKRRALKVIFIASLEDHPFTEGVGEALPLALDPQTLIQAVERALAPEDDRQLRNRHPSELAALAFVSWEPAPASLPYRQTRDRGSLIA